MENQIAGSLKNVFPAGIRTVAVVAPAGPFDPEALRSGIALLEEAGLRVVTSPELWTRCGVPYLAQERAVRLADLNRAIRDPRTDLILCARGGFGSVHLLDGVDWETLRKRALPVMGYSDITALHGAMLARHAGIPVAGPMAAKLVEAARFEMNTAGIRRAFAGKPGEALWDGALRGRRGHAPIYGKPFAANLTVLATLCGTDFQPGLTGRIVILEDVGEPVYKIDRMLTQLAMSGVFRGVRALVFGSFTGTAEQADLERLEDELGARLALPVFRDVPFGHVFPMITVHAEQNWEVRDLRIRVAPAP